PRATPSKHRSLHDALPISGPGVYACTDPACATWTETGITWGNRPPRASTATAETGAIAAGTTAVWDVTPLVTGGGTVTLVVGSAIGRAQIRTPVNVAPRMP